MDSTYIACGPILRYSTFTFHFQSPNGQYIFCCSILRYFTLTFYFQSPINGQYISCCSILRYFTLTFYFQSPNGQYIACGSIDGIVNVFDVNKGVPINTLEGRYYGRVSDQCLMPDEQFFSHIMARTS
jgi:WD40 repeat protein